MSRSGRPQGFLSAPEKQRLQAAIEAAEQRTSGEIRVLISRRASGDPLAAAARAFERLGMRATRDRNGVLILLAVADRRFAIYGDEGVHRHLGQEGWDRLRDEMATQFRAGEFVAGLLRAVEGVGEVLAAHFPPRADDVNELPDQVVEE